MNQTLPRRHSVSFKKVGGKCDGRQAGVKLRLRMNPNGVPLPKPRVVAKRRTLGYRARRNRTPKGFHIHRRRLPSLSNPFGVHRAWTNVTQGALAALATLGFGMKPRWGIAELPLVRGNLLARQNRIPTNVTLTRRKAASINGPWC